MFVARNTQIKKQKNHKNQKSEKQIRNFSSEIKLKTVNNLSSYKISFPLYTKKILSLVYDKYYQTLFKGDQLNKILENLYSQENENVKIGEKKELNKKSKLNYIKNCNDSETMFEKRLRKSIADDVLHCARHQKIEAKLNEKHFKITPIKLYQNNLLNKYSNVSSFLKDHQNLSKKIDQKLSTETTPLKLHSKNVTEKTNEVLPFSRNLFKFIDNDLEEVENNFSEEGLNVLERVDLENALKNNEKNVFRNNIVTENKLLLAEKEELLSSCPDALTRENFSVVTKPDYKALSKPRLSKENIQGLIRQSLTNVMNKRRKSGQDLSFHGTRRISTTSDSQYLSENGDFGNSISEFSFKNMQQSSLDAFEITSEGSQNRKTLQSSRSDSSYNFPDSEDLAEDESRATTMAIRGTDVYISMTKVREQRTLSGLYIGQNKLNKISQLKFYFDGNYGFIDGINLKTLKHKSIAKIGNEEMGNETFLALSHMYSLKKLLHRKSSFFEKISLVTPSSSFKSALLVRELPLKSEEFYSEISQESYGVESHQSFDLSLTKKFKSKHK